MSKEHYDIFYQPLVGSTAAAQHLHGELVKCVGIGLPADTDGAYELLVIGLQDAFKQAGRLALGVHSSEPAERQYILDVDNSLIGVETSVAAVKTVGGIYEEKANVPQHISGVRQNLEKTLRHTYSLAFSDPWTGLLNFSALQYGYSPGRLLNRWRTFFTHQLNPDRNIVPPTFRKGFLTTVDDSGQLDISPRYPRLRSESSNSSCPAAHTKVTLEGSRKAALWAVMQIAGNVALTEIYPRQFDIIPVPELKT